jgi:hypothetical protein
MQPAMLPAEFAAFARHYSGAQRIIEFGSGGSTFFAVTNTRARICSVESDSAWIEKLRAMPAIAAAESEGRLRLIHTDIGQTQEWGWPIDDSTQERWRCYPEAPWAFMRKPDLVFVDGRFRTACILTAILHTRLFARIMVHDFWNRPQYHIALQFLRSIERVETLGIFRRRWRVSEHEVRAELPKYMRDPS